MEHLTVALILVAHCFVILLNLHVLLLLLVLLQAPPPAAHQEVQQQHLHPHLPVQVAVSVIIQVWLFAITVMLVVPINHMDLAVWVELQDVIVLAEQAQLIRILSAPLQQPLQAQVHLHLPEAHHLEVAEHHQRVTLSAQVLKIYTKLQLR